MKHQYFGDINDYRKYGLLRALARIGQLRLGICWMLTADDGRSDGEFRRYLEQPARWRHRDEELYDRLRSLLAPTGVRSIDLAKHWRLFPEAKFHPDLVPVGIAARRAYFERALEAMEGTDLVFFDPDNGIEVPSVGRGSASAPKYVRWDEIAEVYSRGHSVLLYQHYPRRPRVEFESALCERLRHETGAHRLEVFSTAHVAFISLGQIAHTEGLANAVDFVATHWAGEIRHRGLYR